MAVAPKIYQVKVTLAGIEPAIWRRFRVRGDVKLTQLHRILQVLMSWKDRHMYLFESGTDQFVDPDTWEDEWDEEEPGDAEKTKLSSLLRKAGDTLIYRYDMGDNWEHVLLLEEVTSPVPGEAYPVCMAGERSSPPEDVGGTTGYEELLAVLSDPKHRDYKDIRARIDEDWNPEKFDCTRVNNRLSMLGMVKIPGGVAARGMFE
jgi:hypothetical protein